jgi:hypothetical protein
MCVFVSWAKYRYCLYMCVLVSWAKHRYCCACSNMLCMFLFLYTCLWTISHVQSTGTVVHVHVFVRIVFVPFLLRKAQVLLCRFICLYTSLHTHIRNLVACLCENFNCKPINAHAHDPSVYIHAYAHTCASANCKPINSHSRFILCTYVRTYVHTYIRTYIYTYMCKCQLQALKFSSSLIHSVYIHTCIHTYRHVQMPTASP